MKLAHEENYSTATGLLFGSFFIICTYLCIALFHNSAVLVNKVPVSISYDISGHFYCDTIYQLMPEVLCMVVWWGIIIH